MEKILIVEDSLVIFKYLKKTLLNEIENIEVFVAKSFKELKEIFHKNKDFVLALVDVHLPDVNDLSLLDFLLKYNIPSIVMSANFDQKLYEELKNKQIIDFVLKDSYDSLYYIVKLAKRVLNNRNKTVLVIDDSVVSLNYIDMYLSTLMFKTILKNNPNDAILVLENEKVDLVVTDYYMPNLTGIDFIKKSKKILNQKNIFVMGISSDELSAIHFLKFGANDFIKKPFIKEEFYHRINNLAQEQDDILLLKELVNTDFLTKIYNRRYFLEEANKYYKKAKENLEPFVVGMLDIDNFKKINDTYGHDIGDEVIKMVGRVLKEKTKGKDLVARFGGEEFVVLLKEVDLEIGKNIFEKIREKIASTKVYLDKQKYIQVSVSIGIASEYQNSLDDMLKLADERLYIAKNSGKNRVVSSSKELTKIA